MESARAADDEAGITVLCSVHFLNGKLGYAWIDEGHVVRCGEVRDSVVKPQSVDFEGSVIEDDGDMTLLESLQLFVAHFHRLGCAVEVVLSGRADQVVLRTLHKMRVAATHSHAVEFTQSSARERLFLMWPQRSPVFWTSRVDPLAVAAYCALGGLLAQTQRSGVALADVVQERFHPLLCVPESTAEALKLFCLEDHPGAAYGLGKAKEGLSLFSIVNRTLTCIGRETLRRWMLLPTGCTEVLRERHNAIEALLDPHNADAVRAISAQLRHIKQPLRIIDKIAQQRQTSSDYLALLRCASGYLGVAREACKLRGAVAVVERICGRAHEEFLSDIINLLTETVDFTAPATSAKVAVSENVSTELDEVRRAFSSLGMFLTGVAQEEAVALAPGADVALRATFLPQLGYALCLPLHWCRNNMIPVGWEHLFSTGTEGFYKNAKMLQLDTSLGDLHARAVHIQLAIRRQLDERLIALAPALATIGDCGELDALIALAATARDERWCRPIFRDDKGDQSRPATFISVRGAWQPLLPRLSSTAVISFDLDLGCAGDAQPGEGQERGEELLVLPRRQRQRSVMVTGPNGSGKTVVLRAVGAIAFLAHVGSFVPATACHLTPLSAIVVGGFDQAPPQSGTTCSAPPVERHFEGAGRAHRFRGGARAGRSAAHVPVAAGPAVGGTAGAGPAPLEQAIAAAQSCLGRQLSEVSTLFNRADLAASLVLIDEFGRGTLAEDGVALFAAALTHLSACGPRSPLLLFTTHYSEMLTRGLVDQSWLRWLRMRVVVSHDGAELAYLYIPEEQRQLDGDAVLGGGLDSCGVTCARACGMPRVIIERAREVLAAEAAVAHRCHRRLGSWAREPSCRSRGSGGGGAGEDERAALHLEAPLHSSVPLGCGQKHFGAGDADEAPLLSPPWCGVVEAGGGCHG